MLEPFSREQCRLRPTGPLRQAAAKMALGGHRRYRPPVPGRLTLVLMAVAAMAIVALALVWPQGSGRPSPAPFGHALSPVARR